jgi:hypothetical protein
MRVFETLLTIFVFVYTGVVARAQTQESDPFADLTDDSNSQPAKRSFFTDNFGFRKEIMSEFDTSENGQPASRQSLGFEVLKKFSTDTSTIASFNFQGRLVRRDGFQPVLNDMEGANRPGWAFEYHNLYLDLYNVLNPLLSDTQRGDSVGRFNLRVGRFYVPFGLNLQTDTHGTILQLSNERNFGFERDWGTGFFGTINKRLNYDAYYLTGSGYDLQYKGQKGLAAVRLSLSNKYSSEYGLEAGLSVMGGERLSEDTRRPIETRRAGLDGRYRRAVPTGLLTFTSELSGGRDVTNPVYSQLFQTDYLHASRRWGLATQYRRFEQDGHPTEASIFGEMTWYFRNDVGNSNLHWIKVNVERKLERAQGSPALVIALQYYFYR